MSTPNPPEQSYSSEIIEGTEDWHEVIDIYDSIYYEWNELNAWYSPSERRYFWISAAGCSCDSIAEHMNTKSDFESGDRDALVRAVRDFCETAYDLPANEKVNAVAEVRRYKEPS